MIIVPVADDQGVGCGRIYLHAFEIVVSVRGVSAGIQQDLFFLCASGGTPSERPAHVPTTMRLAHEP